MAGSAPLPCDIDEVYQRMMAAEQRRTRRLEGYSVTRRYSLRRGTSDDWAEMGVRLEYTRPGQKTYEILWHRGSSRITDLVFRRLLDAEVEAAQDDVRGTLRISRRNYTFELLATDDPGGRPAYVVRVKPREHRRFLVDGRIWVDMEDYAVTRIEGRPLKTSFWVRKSRMIEQYRKVDGFWVVGSIRTHSDVRFVGPVDVDVDCLDYHIRSVDPSDRAAWNKRLSGR